MDSGAGSGGPQAYPADPPADGAAPCSPSERLLEGAGGLPYRAVTYRPPGSPTRAVILVCDGLGGGAACWGELPSLLCEEGFSVWIPDPCDRVSNSSSGPPVAPAAAFLPLEGLGETALLAALEDSLEQVGLLCVGQAGWVIPHLVRQDPRVGAVVWIAPRDGPDGDGAGAWDLPPDRFVHLLLATSQGDVESSALAGDLFRRFNEGAELRLFSRGADGCQLLAQRHLRSGVRQWLAEWSARASAGRRRGERSSAAQR